MEKLIYDGTNASLTVNTIAPRPMTISWSSWLETFLIQHHEYSIESILYGDDWVHITLKR